MILSLRNYRPNTNLDVLLRAFERVSREEPRARLIMAARGGWIQAEIEAVLDELKLRDRVAQHFAPPDELPELCASADIGISIASTDATPASMIESMASGLPMVMGDAITIDEWITQGEGGELVQCRDEDAVTAALLRADPRPGAARELRRAQRARDARAAATAGAGAGRPLPRHARPRMRVLCLGMDGADHGLVGELLEQGRLPTLAGIMRDGAYGPLRSTLPAATPTAWSSFLTGLNPARHGIFNFSTNANRAPSRVESARSRSGTPLWRTLGAAGHPLGVRDGAVHLSGRGDRRDRRPGLRRPGDAADHAGGGRRRDPARPPRPRHRPPPDARALLGGLRPLRAAPDRARRARSSRCASSASSSSPTWACSWSTS